MELQNLTLDSCLLCLEDRFVPGISLGCCRMLIVTYKIQSHPQPPVIAEESEFQRSENVFGAARLHRLELMYTQHEQQNLDNCPPQSAPCILPAPARQVFSETCCTRLSQEYPVPFTMELSPPPPPRRLCQWLESFVVKGVQVYPSLIPLASSTAAPLSLGGGYRVGLRCLPFFCPPPIMRLIFGKEPGPSPTLHSV